MTVATFYAETMAALADVGRPTHIHAAPNEVSPAIPFRDDHQHAAYDPQAAHLFWRQLEQTHRVMQAFRSNYVGKASPVHFFWGGMDMAYTRFSGRPAPPHPGGAPNCPPWIMREAYSQELASCGFWPGGSAEGSFYAYAYPEPPGYAEAPVGPAAAGYDPGTREFLLPYEDVASSADPDQALTEFLQSTYAAAADLARWDRSTLETDGITRV
jgi:hypothetical protein